MAKRLSVKEILEAGRKGGAAKPAEAPSAAPAEETEAVTAEEEGSEAIAAGPSSPEPVPPTRPAAAVDVPTPSSLGRPLTLKEKLAAARAGGAAQPSAGAAAPSAPVKAKAPVPAAAVEESAPVAESVAAEQPRAVPAPAAPLGRAMTLQEKLAAARGGGAQPAAPAGAAKPAAPKPAAAAAAKTGAARVLPPLEKMTDPRDLAEAARQASAKKAKELAAKSAETAPAKARPAAGKAAPAKPQTVPPRPTRELAATASAAGPDFDRRGFFVFGLFIAWIWIAWTTFTAALSAMTLMTVRFMFPNVLAEPPSTIKIGLLTNFAPEDVSERFKTEWGFWVVRSARYNGADILYALQSVCTHLGCPPNWLASEQKFKCPCHGSGFYISGINFEGPAPRPLERFRVALADDGQILVDKSRRFQEELDQWSDPDSFIPA